MQNNNIHSDDRNGRKQPGRYIACCCLYPDGGNRNAAKLHARHGKVFTKHEQIGSPIGAARKAQQVCNGAARLPSALHPADTMHNHKRCSQHCHISQHHSRNRCYDDPTRHKQATVGEITIPRTSVSVDTCLIAQANYNRHCMQRTPQGNQTNDFNTLHTRLAHTQLTKAYMTCSITR